VARDRIIAALGRAVLVIETRPRGGTLHTVRAAEQLGRPLFVLKYHAPPESARGNSILIARGATDISRFSEVEKILGVM
jgi:predicted Rossmann fold nucleotide-binding protein DprA/Smf involved in DNA uptake